MELFARVSMTYSVAVRGGSGLLLLPIKLPQPSSLLLPSLSSSPSPYSSSSSSSSLNSLYTPKHLSLTPVLRSSVAGSALPLALLQSPPQLLESAEEAEQEQELQDVSQEGEEEDSERAISKSSRPSAPSKFSPLGSKEKKQLRAYAHQLGKDLVVQTVGKWGVTSTVITSLSDALEANELIKVKVLDNCQDELDDILQKLADSTESQIVGKIGRTVLLYRPSLTKLAAAQKKEQKQAKKQRSQSARHRRGINDGR